VYDIYKFAYIGKGCVAIFKVTHVGFFTGVDSLVDLQGRFLVEPFVAVFFRTDKGPVICMDLIVSGEITSANKCLL
jgi:hypothetical protein